MAFSPIKSNATMDHGCRSGRSTSGPCVPHNSVSSMKRLKGKGRLTIWKGRKIFVLGSGCDEMSQLPLRNFFPCTTSQELGKVGIFFGSRERRGMTMTLWKLNSNDLFFLFVSFLATKGEERAERRLKVIKSVRPSLASSCSQFSWPPHATTFLPRFAASL